MPPSQASSQYLTHAQVVELLVSRKGDRPIGELALDIGISRSMLTNILGGFRRADGERVLKYLGLEKVTMFTYKRTGARG